MTFTWVVKFEIKFHVILIGWMIVSNTNLINELETIDLFSISICDVVIDSLLSAMLSYRAIV